MRAFRSLKSSQSVIRVAIKFYFYREPSTHTCVRVPTGEIDFAGPLIYISRMLQKLRQRNCTGLHTDENIMLVTKSRGLARVMESALISLPSVENTRKSGIRYNVALPEASGTRRNSANNYNFRWETAVYISSRSCRRTSFRNVTFMVPLVLSSSEFLVSKFLVAPRPVVVRRHPRRRLPFLALHAIRSVPRHIRSDSFSSDYTTANGGLHIRADAYGNIISLNLLHY
jgi:hypothetical protein